MFLGRMFIPEKHIYILGSALDRDLTLPLSITPKKAASKWHYSFIKTYIFANSFFLVFFFVCFFSGTGV
jgi:hypothetical protein